MDSNKKRFTGFLCKCAHFKRFWWHQNNFGVAYIQLPTRKDYDRAQNFHHKLLGDRYVEGKRHMNREQFIQLSKMKISWFFFVFLCSTFFIFVHWNETNILLCYRQQIIGIFIKFALVFFPSINSIVRFMWTCYREFF